MIATHGAKTAATPADSSAVKDPAAKKRGARPAQNGEPVSRDARRVAVAILEVLAGVRTPTDAAKTLGLSPPRYYLWEQRALEGLVRACEPRPKGKRVSQGRQVALLEKEVTRLRQECLRQQSLARAAQRTMTLPPPAAGSAAAKGNGKTPAKPDGAAAGKGKRKRRPVVRALQAAAALQSLPEGEGGDGAPTDSSSANGAEMVQRMVMDRLLPLVAQASAAVTET